MVSNTIALQGANPPVNALGAFSEGAKTAVGIDGAKLQQAAATMEIIGAGAMHALNGNINGEVDPAKYNEVLDSFQAMGLPAETIAKFRNNPQMAKVAAQASVSALDRLKLARSDRDYELALQKFEMDVMQAAQSKPASPLGKLAADFEAGLIDEDTFNAARAKATQSSGGITVNPDGTVQIGGTGQTKGRTEVDKKYADDFVDWNARGAYADVNKQIEQLEVALDSLETKGNITGPLVGSIPDALSAVINPDAVSTRELVEEVVQRNLRLVLGAQFTEKEGERLIARAYNPRLSEEENARRVKRLITQIKTAAEAKQAASEYFAANGTLTGWDGKLPTISDFDPESDARSEPASSRTFKATRTIDGVTYGQDENGDWFEVE